MGRSSGIAEHGASLASKQATQSLLMLPFVDWQLGAPWHET